MAGFYLGEIEDVIHQSQQVSAGSSEHFHVLPGRGVQFHFPKQIRHPEDGVKWRPNFMADGREELAFRVVRPVGIRTPLHQLLVYFRL